MQFVNNVEKTQNEKYVILHASCCLVNKDSIVHSLNLGLVTAPKLSTLKVHSLCTPG